jgi:3-dehydroquinate dehydratase-1
MAPVTRRTTRGRSGATIGRLRLGGVPRVVLCVTDARGGRLPAGCRPDVIEARIDLFERRSPAHVEETLGKLRRYGHPIIATIRTATEGGRWQGSDTERERLFGVTLPFVQAVDVELSSRAIRQRVVEAAHAAGRRVIVSSHDFKRTPAAAVLVRRMDEARRAGADLVKLAAHARDASDLCRLLQVLVNHPAVPLIVLAMGPVGMMSRVFFGAAGSLLTYAFADGDAPTAAGQLSLRALQAELARYYPGYAARSANRGTKTRPI